MFGYLTAVAARINKIFGLGLDVIGSLLLEIGNQV